MQRPSLAKIDLIEIKRVRLNLGSERRKKKVPKMKNCRSMLLKTHGEKMSLSGPETMLMKTNEL